MLAVARDEPTLFSVEVLKYDPSNKSSKSTVETAIRVFRGSFDQLIMENGRDLIEMVATAYESPDQDAESDEDTFDFSKQ